MSAHCPQFDVKQCPVQIQPYTTCGLFPPKFDQKQCLVTIPGYFKFKSRFVDFTGQYVFHCHILAHEDRGMMELIQVIPKPMSPYGHQ